MERMHRAALGLCAFVLAVAPIAAEGVASSTQLEIMGDYIFPNKNAYNADGFAPVEYGTIGGNAGQRTIGSSWGGGELKAVLDHSIVIPALAGTDALTKDNNAALDFSGELSPVSLNAAASATLTPIAFVKLAVGGKIGTGWDTPLGEGLAGNDGGNLVSNSFGGAVCKAWVSGTFQFDLAAPVPGDWDHVVLLAAPKVEYQYYTGADATTAWRWEADDGMNYNGLKLKGSYVLAYQMPLALNMVGILAEPEGYLYIDPRAASTMASGGWGSDATTWGLSAIFNFKLSDTSSLAVLPQFKSFVKWTDATTLAADFRDRVFEGYYWSLNHIAFDFSLKL
jgi:hypothetical protein